MERHESMTRAARYLFGDPGAPVTSLFGLTPIVTNSIASGTFLVGSGSATAAEIRDRMGMQVEISTQHSDYFVKNLIAIRAEKRCALVPSGLIRDGHVQPVACLAV